jgi:predicted flap endonuclease-1-like 5' DNA nuclease
MIPALLQIILMLLGAAIFGALVYRSCYCKRYSSCEDHQLHSDSCSKKSVCPTCSTCAAGTCAMNAACPKKCPCGSKKSATPLAAAASTVAVAAASMKKQDDLVIIEGIGPAIHKILNAHGVHTFADVVNAKKDEIHTWLNAAGPQFKMHDASTWAEQAALARDGKMAELEALKTKLNNGQYV